VNVSPNVEWPRVLLVGLVVATVVAAGFAASTSSASFSTYNSDWSGSSALQKHAERAGSDVVHARTVSDYDSVRPNQSVAMILSPERAYSPEDATRINRFVRRGGTVVVVDDFGQHANPLLASIGASAAIAGDPVRDERHNYRSAALPVANNVSNASMVRNVSEIVLNYGSVVRPGEATVLVNTSEFAYLDRNRNQQLDARESLDTRPVVTVESMGTGRLVVVSDPSVFTNAMLERPGNRQFVETLFEDHETVLIDYSHSASRLPPLAAGMLIVRDSLPLQVGLGVLGLAAIAVLARSRPLDAVSNRLDRTPDDEPVSLSVEDAMTGVERRYDELDEARVRRIVERFDRVGENEATEGDATETEDGSYRPPDKRRIL
jgi:hypothetical protein